MGMMLGYFWFGLMCTYAVSLWYGNLLITKERMNPNSGKPWTGGEVLTVFFGVLFAGMNLGQAGPGIQCVQAAKKVIAKITTVISRTPIVTSPLNAAPVSLSKGITFTDVVFGYPSTPDVKALRGVSFSIKAGQFVALVGPSGCGKSTIIQMLERFYDPESGALRMGGADGTPWPALDLIALRRQIGYVGQEPALFDMSIADNIRFGNLDATEDEVIEAAKLAHAHDFITSLPEGYKTMVGEGGGRLSGGQKQRVAIARALVRKPTLLLLDESTSALDTTTERLVQASLETLAKQGLTIVAVAHRLSTITAADKIIVMNDGRVVDEGTHNELLAKDGLYATLVHKQSLANEDESGHSISQSAALTRTMPNEMGSRKRTASIENSETSTENEEEEQPQIPPEKVKGNIRRIGQFMLPVWQAVVIGCFCAVVMGGSMPAFSFLFTEMLKIFYRCSPVECDDNPLITCYGGTPIKQDCYDEMSDKASFVAGMLVVLGVFSGIASFAVIYSFQYIAQSTTINIRQKLFSHIMSQSISFFDEPGESRSSMTPFRFCIESTR